MCFGCVLWQAWICSSKYTELPTGAAVDVINTKDVSISFTFCMIVYNLMQNSNGRLFDTEISQLVSITAFTKEIPLHLVKEGQKLNYDYIALIPEQYICKEFPLPKTEIEKIEITHEAFLENSNFHLFIHQTGMFLNPEMVVQYSNKIFHKSFDGNVQLQLESYDLKDSTKISCRDVDLHSCKMERIILEYNKTIGCSFPVQR